jgi:hypothetical protein
MFSFEGSNTSRHAAAGALNNLHIPSVGSRSSSFSLQMPPTSGKHQRQLSGSGLLQQNFSADGQLSFFGEQGDHSIPVRNGAEFNSVDEEDDAEDRSDGGDERFGGIASPRAKAAALASAQQQFSLRGVLARPPMNGQKQLLRGNSLSARFDTSGMVQYGSSSGDAVGIGSGSGSRFLHKRSHSDQLHGKLAAVELDSLFDGMNLNRSASGDDGDYLVGSSQGMAAGQSGGGGHSRRGASYGSYLDLIGGRSLDLLAVESFAEQDAAHVRFKHSSSQDHLPAVSRSSTFDMSDGEGRGGTFADQLLMSPPITPRDYAAPTTGTEQQA